MMNETNFDLKKFGIEPLKFEIISEVYVVFSFKKYVPAIDLVEVKAKRGQALALRWLMDATRKRKNKTMAEKLYAEILDASQNKGSAIKKREDTHKMAESNKAFAHFRW